MIDISTFRLNAVYFVDRTDEIEHLSVFYLHYVCAETVYFGLFSRFLTKKYSATIVALFRYRPYTVLTMTGFLVINILVLPPGGDCLSKCALPMPGTADGHVVSRCKVFGYMLSLFD